MGQLRCEARKESTGQTVRTDISSVYGGLGEHFSPTELVTAGLGACLMGVTAIVAQRNGLDVSSMRTRLEMEMTSSPARRIASIKAVVTLPQDVPEPLRQKLAAAANVCPVKNSLHPDVRVDLEFVYK